MLPQAVRAYPYQWIPSVNLSHWYKEWELCLISKDTSSIVTSFKDSVQGCLTKKTRVAFRCNVGNTYYCKFYEL